MSQKSRPLPLLLGLLCSGALGLAALSARSQTPAPSASAPASGAPSAAPAASASASPSGDPSASPSGSAAASAPKNVLRGADIPTETSEMPKDKKDWDAGKVVAPNKGTTPCELKLLREWLRIECQPRIGGALVVGEPADVKIWAWGNPLAGLDNAQAKLLGPPPVTVIVLPLRRGEAQIFDLMRPLEGDWDWIGPSAAERISIAWREGSEDPMLLVGSR